MQQKKRILLLATGGTIASRKSDNGLKPQITPEELIEYIPQVKEICDVEAVQLLNLDSTNMEPSHWKLMVHAIWEHYDDFDGFVIAHGTDTMAYTAAALSYMVQNTKKPIVITGAAEADRPGDHGREVEPDRQPFYMLPMTAHRGYRLCLMEKSSPEPAPRRCGPRATMHFPVLTIRRSP